MKPALAEMGVRVVTLGKSWQLKSLSNRLKIRTIGRNSTYSDGHSLGNGHCSSVGGLTPQALSLAGLRSSDLIHLMERFRTPIIENRDILWRCHDVLPFLGQ